MRSHFIIKSFIVLLSLFLLNTHISAAKNDFTDISNEYWAYKEIQYLSSKNVIKGYDDKTFKPGLQITRKQAAMMLSRALSLHSEVKTKHPIRDITPTTTGFEAMNAVVKNRMFHTYDGKFLPDQPFTRQDMAKALTVAFQLEGSGASIYSDVPYDHPYYQYIDSIAANNITTGYTDGTYRPENPVTRAQFSAFLARIFMFPQAYEVRQGTEVLYCCAELFPF